MQKRGERVARIGSAELERQVQTALELLEDALEEEHVCRAASGFPGFRPFATRAHAIQHVTLAAHAIGRLRIRVEGARPLVEAHVLRFDVEVVGHRLHGLGQAVVFEQRKAVVERVHRLDVGE